MGKVWQKRMVLTLAALLPLALAGCDGFFVPESSGSGTAITSDYVYVANANPSEASVAAFSISTTGTATAITGSPYALNFVPTALAVTPNNSFLYVGGTTGLYAYSIGSTGALTLVGSAGASIPVASIAVTPDGSYLFALQSNVIIGTAVTPTQYSVTLDEYQITSSGALALSGTSAFTTTSGNFTPKSVRLSKNGGLLALALGSAGTSVYQLISDVPSTTANLLAESNLSSDNDLAFDSSSSYLYIVRSGISSGLAAYTASSTGALQQVGSSLATAGSQPGTMTVDPTGKFAYVLNYGSGSISAYSLSAGSLPSVLSGSPYSTGTQPIGLVSDNSGKFLLNIDSGGTPDLQVWTYNTSATGALTSASTIATGTDPTLPIAIAATH